MEKIELFKKLRRRLKLNDQHANRIVKFSAWDGINVSNKINLIYQRWNSVYIKGEQKKFKALLKKIKKV